MEQTIATAVNKEPFSFKKMFFKCFPLQDKNEDDVVESPISAVRLQISVNDAVGKRKITLKGLYGDVELIKSFTQSFRIKMHEAVKAIPSRKSDSSIA